MTTPRDQVPGHTLRPTLAIPAVEGNGHAAHVRAEEAQRALHTQQRSRQSLWLAHEPTAHKPRQSPQTQMEGANLERCEDLHAIEARVAARQQIKVRSFAGAQPARAEPGHGLAAQVLPAVDRWLQLSTRGRKRAAESAEDRLGGGKARIETVARCDDDASRLERGESRRVRV